MSRLTAEILSLIAEMRPESQPAGRTLLPELTKLLEDVAHHHGGKVPLHGRLFAHWMHYAPHKSGIINPETVDDYADAVKSNKGRAGPEEMILHAQEPRNATDNSSVDTGLCSAMCYLVLVSLLLLLLLLLLFFFFFLFFSLFWSTQEGT
ncbi:unnamed protein product [Polarella glacialis]|uniref:Uncharacterized protein n=1 Tax=Polarella glacialis TaxID=89957 RepID=A0A813F8K5_POLGL|nr:unnamed protein product [Polarella glacialis]